MNLETVSQGQELLCESLEDYEPEILEYPASPQDDSNIMPILNALSQTNVIKQEGMRRY